MTETYMSWYKKRMHRIIDPTAYSLMSSSVGEPWSLLKQVHDSPETDQFEDYFWTPNAYGHETLVKRISEKYEVPEESILLTQGATGAIFLLCNTFLSEGDHVVTERPGYEPLFQSPEANGARVDFLPRIPGKRTSASDVRKCVLPTTKLIFLTDFHNPSGVRFTESELMTIVETAVEVSPSVKIVVDEIYLDFIPDRRPPSYNLHPSIITVSSLTKVYGLSILRCGWIFAQPDVLQPLRDRQVLISGIGSRYLESLSVQVFDNLSEFWELSKNHVTQNKQIFREIIEPLIESGQLAGEVAEYGCVSFLKLSGVKKSREFVEYLDENYDVLTVPGEFFGAPDYIRMGIGEITATKLRVALKRFKEAIATYPGFDQ